ncbi:hypothetical protein FDENT_7742 [Fusarium denticulatum]|uniref:Uncharacterized protein n=1 Tax=Fusarium denticulatum TaxID=48507 RepID=A0A8H5U1F7_9HYPO|nr:hypothetical protein FDENT_7742 [Fusarium denticulatum]
MMSNQSYEDMPYWGTCALDPSFACEKPSPLSIVKADENMIHPYARGSRPRPSYQSGRRDGRAQSPEANWDKATGYPPRYRVNCLGFTAGALCNKPRRGVATIQKESTYGTDRALQDTVQAKARTLVNTTDYHHTRGHDHRRRLP